MQNRKNALRRWELALILSLSLTVCQGFTLPAAHTGWWGVIFPALSGGEEAVQTVSGGLDVGIELRFRLLDWLGELLGNGSDTQTRN